jgi:pyruvate-ferredoxin/flavodoxin oxidoreductase
LYRYNPALKADGQNPFILDCKKPDGSLKNFLEGEVRYASLKRTFPEEADRLHTALIDQFNKRYEELALMADPTLVCKQEKPVE